MLYLESKDNQEKIIDKILKLIDSKSLVIPYERKGMLIYLVYRLSNHLGIQKNDAEVIRIYQSVINIGLSYNEFYLLKYFY